MSTIQPGRKQVDSENGDYNGDISYGSEMEREFNSMSPDKEESSTPTVDVATPTVAETVASMEESQKDDVAESSTTTKPTKETENGMEIATDTAEENNHKMETDKDKDDTKATTDSTIGKLIDVEENSSEVSFLNNII